MKELQELTVEDLKRHRVWHYYSTRDGDAGAKVEPSVVETLSEDDERVFLVATRFRFSDGSEQLGFCSPQDDSGLGYLQPVIVADDGHVPLWFGRPVPHEEQDAWWRRLHKLSPAGFPIVFECLVPVDGAFRRGVVDQSDVFGDAA